MLPELAVGIVLILTGAFSFLTYRWGVTDARKKYQSEKYHFGEKKYQEGYATALQDLKLPEFSLLEDFITPSEPTGKGSKVTELPDPSSPKSKRLVKKFKKGKK